MTEKIIKRNFILKEDTTIEGDLIVEGNITGYYNLTVRGRIDALNIHAWDIDARDIDALNIHAQDIDAQDIDARDIHARDIICISRKKKSKEAKTIAYSIILDRFNRERKEVMPNA